MNRKRSDDNMTIEEKVFLRRRFVPELLAAHGFTEEKGCFTKAADLMDGDFTAQLTVYPPDRISGTVTDNMNGEGYAPLRNENFNGAYVSSVRAAYEELLCQLAEKCCERVLFVSDQANRIAALIAEAFGVEPDFPWEGGRYDSAGVFRHSDSKKWFGLVMNITRGALFKTSDKTTTDVLNLKASPEAFGKKGVYPAYHMNHKLWISVPLDDTLTDGEVMQLISESFELTSKKEK